MTLCPQPKSSAFCTLFVAVTTTGDLQNQTRIKPAGSHTGVVNYIFFLYRRFLSVSAMSLITPTTEVGATLFNRREGPGPTKVRCSKTAVQLPSDYGEVSHRPADQGVIPSPQWSGA